MTAESTAAPNTRRQRSHLRMIRTRPRLFISAAFGLVILAIVFPAFDWRAVTKLLVGWNVGIGLYLILAAAMASMAAIFSELATTGGAPRQPAQLLLATSTIVLSWAFIHSMFALHYAHEFYGNGRDGIVSGISFPDDNEPDYWDFCYFAFTLGMCAQVSDATISSKSIRRTALS